MDKNKIYFASDFHLGSNGRLTSLEREKQIVRWLEMIRSDAAEIYLVGDVFDFWFEYKTVVPRGYLRFFGKLRELRDQGIDIYFFTGNHDMWMFDYFEKELEIPIYREPITRKLGSKNFFIGHGDGLGPGDHGYKFLKKVLSNSLCQWLYARLHPNFGLWLMQFSSGKSRELEHGIPAFQGLEKEWLAIFANNYKGASPIDYFIFGHRHLTIDCTLNQLSGRYINLGEWLYTCSYAVFDGTELEIKFFENKDGKIIKV